MTKKEAPEEDKQPRMGGPIGYALGGLVILVIFGVLIAVFIFPTLFFQSNLTGETAKDFSLTDVYGEEVSLYQIIDGTAVNSTGPKVVVLDFFSLSCDPCKEEMKELKELWAEVDQTNVSFISIGTDMGDSNSRLQGYREKNDYNWTFARDNKNVANDYSVTAIPTLVVIDRDYEIVAYRVGLQGKGTVRGDIENALSRT